MKDVFKNYNKVALFLPPIRERRKRSSAEERLLDEKYLLVDKNVNILSLFFKIPLEYFNKIKTRKGQFRFILDTLEWRNDNKIDTNYECLVIKAVEFSKYIPKNNI